MYKKPQFRFFVILPAFLAIFLALSSSAQAKETFEGRYFISSKNYLVKSLFGVQHDFKDGFTADLTSGEVWTLEKIFKIDVASIPLYKVSALELSQDSTTGSVISEAVGLVQSQDILKGLKPVKVRSIKPTEAVPWGVKQIYNNDNLTSTNGGEGVNVAILDTGANIKHLDLVNNVRDCKDFTRGAMPRSACEDKNGHGTHVAGTVAADGGSDQAGIWGVASEANLLIYKVCRNDGTCWADDIATALSYAVQNGANVVSMSLGGNTETLILKAAIDEAVNHNVLIVAAAGNDGPDKGSIDWPAAYENVIAVGALASDGMVPDWSSRGVNDGDFIVEAREVEFAAPGVNVESTWYDGSYRFLSGTSMATPHISGLAAKLWNGYATSTRANLQRLARDVWLPGDDTATGLGLPRLETILSNIATEGAIINQ